MRDNLTRESPSRDLVSRAGLEWRLRAEKASYAGRSKPPSGAAWQPGHALDNLDFVVRPGDNANGGTRLDDIICYFDDPALSTDIKWSPDTYQWRGLTAGPLSAMRSP